MDVSTSSKTQAMAGHKRSRPAAAPVSIAAAHLQATSSALPRGKHHDLVAEWWYSARSAAEIPALVSARVHECFNGSLCAPLPSASLSSSQPSPLLPLPSPALSSLRAALTGLLGPLGRGGDTEAVGSMGSVEEWGGPKGGDALAASCRAAQGICAMLVYVFDDSTVFMPLASSIQSAVLASVADVDATTATGKAIRKMTDAVAELVLAFGGGLACIRKVQSFKQHAATMMSNMRRDVAAAQVLKAEMDDEAQALQKEKAELDEAMSSYAAHVAQVNQQGGRAFDTGNVVGVCLDLVDSGDAIATELMKDRRRNNERATDLNRGRQDAEELEKQIHALEALLDACVQLTCVWLDKHLTHLRLLVLDALVVLDQCHVAVLSAFTTEFTALTTAIAVAEKMVIDMGAQHRMLTLSMDTFSTELMDACGAAKASYEKSIREAHLARANIASDLEMLADLVSRLPLDARRLVCTRVNTVLADLESIDDGHRLVLRFDEDLLYKQLVAAVEACPHVDNGVEAEVRSSRLQLSLPTENARLDCGIVTDGIAALAAHGLRTYLRLAACDVAIDPTEMTEFVRLQDMRRSLFDQGTPFRPS